MRKGARRCGEVYGTDWAEAVAHASTLRSLVDAPKRTRRLVRDAAERHGVSTATVYRWMAAFKAGGYRTSSLLPAPRGAAPGSRRLAADVEAVVERCIARLWDKPERPRPAAIVRRVREECLRAGLQPPGESTVRRRIRTLNSVTLQETSGRRRRRDAAIEPVTGSFPETKQPLEVVQIDHTLVDVIIVDTQDRKPIGRPWVTLGIDVASRCVTGFCLSLDPPSATSVALCMAHTLVPKEIWLEARSLDIDLPIFGVPRILHADNAKEFHAAALRRGCEEFGIDLVHRPRGRPHFGGHIERLIGTVMGEIHLLPGTTHSNPQERGPYISDATACLTLAELERWLALAIDVYHRSLHAAVGTSPLALWSALNRRPGETRRLLRPADPEGVLIAFLPGVRRQVTRTGVRLFHIDYWSDALRPLLGSDKDRLVRFDPRDLSRVWLKAPNGDDLALPYRRRHRPPISLSEHRAITAELRRAGRAAIDEDLIFAQREAMRDVVAESRRNSKRVRREAERMPADPKPGKAIPIDPDAKPAGRLYDIEDW